VKFTVNNSPQTDVTFRAEIDEDGDLMLYANDCKLLFITHKGGHLARMSVPNDRRAALAGLSFDEEDHIELSV
jgi:hypothetical protein